MADLGLLGHAARDPVRVPVGEAGIGGVGAGRGDPAAAERGKAGIGRPVRLRLAPGGEDGKLGRRHLDRAAEAEHEEALHERVGDGFVAVEEHIVPVGMEEEGEERLALRREQAGRERAAFGERADVGGDHRLEEGAGVGAGNPQGPAVTEVGKGHRTR